MAVDYRETLVTYLHATTTEEAAKTLNISSATLHSRLAQMKKRGVKVPPKAAKNQLNDLGVAQLNSIINKHLKEK